MSTAASRATGLLDECSSLLEDKENDLIEEVVNLQKGRRDQAGEIGNLKGQIKQLQSHPEMHKLVKELFEDLRARLAFKSDKSSERVLAPLLLSALKSNPRETGDYHVYLSSPSYWSSKPPWLNGTGHCDKSSVIGTSNLLVACRKMVRGLEAIEEQTHAAREEEQNHMIIQLIALAAEKEELRIRLEAAEDELREVKSKQRLAGQPDDSNSEANGNKDLGLAQYASVECCSTPEGSGQLRDTGSNMGSPSPSTGSSGVTDLEDSEERRSTNEETPVSWVHDVGGVLSSAKTNAGYGTSTGQSTDSGHIHGELREMWRETNALREELAEERKEREQERRALLEQLKASTDESAAVQGHLKEMEMEGWKLREELERQAMHAAKTQGELEAELQEKEEELLEVGDALGTYEAEVKKLRENHRELEGELRGRRSEVADIEGCLKSASAVLEGLRAEGIAVSDRVKSEMREANDSHGAEVQSLQGLVDSTNRELELALTKASESAQKIKEAEDRWREAERGIQEKEKKLKYVHEAYDRKKAELRREQMVAEGLREEVERFRIQIAQAEKDRAGMADVDELKQAVRKLEEELQEAIQERDEALQTVVTLTNRVEELGEEMEGAWKVSGSLQDSLQATNESLARFRGEVETLNAEVDRQRAAVRSREEDVAAVKSELESVQGVSETRGREVEDVKSRLERARVQVSTHGDAEELWKGRAEGLRLQLERISEGLQRAEAEKAALLADRRELQRQVGRLGVAEGVVQQLGEQLRGAQEQAARDRGEKKRFEEQSEAALAELLSVQGRVEGERKAWERKERELRVVKTNLVKAEAEVNLLADDGELLLADLKALSKWLHLHRNRIGLIPGAEGVRSRIQNSLWTHEPIKTA